MPINIFTTVEDPLATQDTQGQGINNAGQIVGDYADASGGHGFLLSGGVFTTIDEPVAAGNATSAKAINNFGQIVGTYNDAVGVHGFLLNGGIFTTIDDPLATPGNTQ